MATNFPFSAKRGDPENGYMVVQQMVLWLRDIYDTFAGKIARGQSTVLATATTVVCTIPATVGGTYSVTATPLANTGGNWWISGKTGTQFTINLAVAAPVGGIAFDWTVKGA